MYYELRKILDRHDKIKVPRRVRFEGKPPSLLTMTDTKSIKVLKEEEVERGNHGTVVELPFVEIVDEEAESTTQDVTVKLPATQRHESYHHQDCPQCQQGVISRPIDCSQEPLGEGLGIVRRG